MPIKTAVHEFRHAKEDDKPDGQRTGKEIVKIARGPKEDMSPLDDIAVIAHEELPGFPKKILRVFRITQDHF